MFIIPYYVDSPKVGGSSTTSPKVGGGAAPQKPTSPKVGGGAAPQKPTSPKVGGGAAPQQPTSPKVGGSSTTSPKVGGGPAPQKPTSPEFKLWKVWVFLAKGGTEVWETDEPCNTQETIDNYLTPNGFVGEHKFYKGSLYVKMDTTMDLSNLYSWKDFLEKAEDIPDVPVLRPLIWVGDKPGVKDEWGWSEQASGISLGKYGSLDKLWERIASVW